MRELRESLSSRERAYLLRWWCVISILWLSNSYHACGTSFDQIKIQKPHDNVTINWRWSKKCRNFDMCVCFNTRVRYFIVLVKIAADQFSTVFNVRCDFTALLWRHFKQQPFDKLILKNPRTTTISSLWQILNDCRMTRVLRKARRYFLLQLNRRMKF